MQGAVFDPVLQIDDRRRHRVEGDGRVWAPGSHRPSPAPAGAKTCSTTFSSVAQFNPPVCSTTLVASCIEYWCPTLAPPE
jgi:hypothetical protein